MSFPIHRFSRVASAALALSALLGLSACGSDAGTPAPAAKDANSGDSAAGDSASGDGVPGPKLLCGKYKTDTEVLSATDKPLSDKGYFLAVQAFPFGNLQLFFRATVIGHKDAAGGMIKMIALRAISGKTKEETGIIAAACDVPIAADGSFTMNFGDAVLPAVASPSDTDVKLTLTLKGKFTGVASFCGDMDGDVPDFSITLAGSKFKGVEFGTQTDPPESSCEGNTAKQYSGIAACPALLPGDNTMTSAERSRTFIVQLPKDVSDVSGLPIIFLYHGVGGEPDKMITESGLSAEQAKTPFILVAPRSERKDGKAILKSDWYYGSPLYKNDNPDLVFFDDLLKCVGEKYKYDSKRVYVTGMSGGGLMSTFLGIHKAAVIAAAAPFSGGYLQAWPTNSGKAPYVVSWGGAEDLAYEQNFDKMAASLITSLRGAGHTVVQCNHGLKHKWPPEGGAYAAKFLLAHKLDQPSPFATALGDGWPSYCSLAK